MKSDSLRVVIVDRHAWYLPVIEEEELRKIGAKVVVGWAESPSRPAIADQGDPKNDRERAYLSRITAGYVPASVTTEDEVIRMAQNADAILVAHAKISARVIGALPDLRVIGRYGIGLDNVDLVAARDRGIAVVNAPGFCAREVADHAMMFVLALSRRLQFMDSKMRAGCWARDIASPMGALYTQTMGIVGFGAIGQEIARRAGSFGMAVIAYDPFINTERAREFGVEPAELNDLLNRADYVSLSLPLVAETHHLIGEQQLRSMKKTAFLINTSRGPLIDEKALIKALDEGTIAGAGLDVYETEPLPSESPLTKFPNVLLTPHIGGYSDEGGEIVRRTVARGIAAVFNDLK